MVPGFLGHGPQHKGAASGGCVRGEEGERHRGGMENGGGTEGEGIKRVNS